MKCILSATLFATLALALISIATAEDTESIQRSPIEKDISEKVSSGVYSHDIRSPRPPRIYESFAALTYEFKRPSLQIPKELRAVQCKGSKYSDGVYCPVLYYLHELDKELKEASSLLEPQFPESLDTEAFHISSCTEIRKHFRGRTINKNQLAKYQRALEDCARNMTVSEKDSQQASDSDTEELGGEDRMTTPQPGRMNGTIDIMREIERLRRLVSSPSPPPASANITKVIESTPPSEFLFESVSSSLRNMSKDFLREYYSFLPSELRVDAAILANQETAAYALGLGIFLTQASIWTNALDLCKNSLIPTQLLPWERLQVSLKSLEQKLYAQSKSLVIPSSNRTIYEYYANPLADCVATSDTVFLRVLIPVKKYDSRWKSMSLTTIPFLYNDGEDGAQLVCSVSDAQNAKHYAYDLKSQAVYAQPYSVCDPRSALLCHMGERSTSLASFRKNCFTEIIRRTPFSQLKKVCQLDCDSSTSYNLPIVVNVAPNVYYVAGKRELPKPGNSTFTGLTIKCVDRQTEHFNFPPEGVLELQPPCGCEILHNNIVIAPAIEPYCRSKLYITLVKPMHLAPASTV